MGDSKDGIKRLSTVSKNQVAKRPVTSNYIAPKSKIVLNTPKGRMKF